MVLHFEVLLQRSSCCWRTILGLISTGQTMAAWLPFTVLPSEAILKLSNCFWHTRTSMSMRRTRVGQLPFYWVVWMAMWLYFDCCSRILGWTSRFAITKDVHHYGLHLALDIFLRLNGSLPAREISKSTWKDTGTMNTSLLTLQECGGRIKLWHCWKGLPPTQHRFVMSYKWSWGWGGCWDLCLGRFPVRWTSSTQATHSHHLLLQPSCCSILHDCCQVAHGAADGALSSYGWFNEVKYSLQGFRRCLQVPCKDSISLKESRWQTSFWSDLDSWLLVVFVCFLKR